MSKEVNAIIENLCSKLGTSARYLIPELAKKNIAEDIACIIMSLLVGLVLFKVAPKVWQYDREHSDSYDGTFWIIVPLIVGGITLLTFVVSVNDLVGWAASPTAKAVELITNMLKGD